MFVSKPRRYAVLQSTQSFLAIFILIAVFSFAACDKDEPASERIVGAWSIVSVNDTDIEEYTLSDDDLNLFEDCDLTDYSAVFNADGTGTIGFVIACDDTGTTSFSSTFDWSVDDDADPAQLIITGTGQSSGSLTADIVDLADDRMTVESNGAFIADDAVSEHIVFER